jgi:hypothetical protein
MRMLAIAFLSGCGIDPFETPSAYDQQQYLCDDDHQVLQDKADECHDEPADGVEPCKGYISFRGQIQLVQIHVDTTLERGIVQYVGDVDAGEVVQLSRVDLSGAAPYFHFDVTISSIGTDWPEYPHGTRPDDKPLTFGDPESKTDLNLEDGHGAVQWYIRAGSDTAMLTGNPATESVILPTFLSPTQVDLDFAGGLGPVDDYLDACAIVFPEPPPIP